MPQKIPHSGQMPLKSEKIHFLSIELSLVEPIEVTDILRW